MSSEARFEAIVGNEEWLAEHNVPMEREKQVILNAWKAHGKSVVLLAMRETAGAAAYSLTALFGLADPVREEAPAVVQHLQRQGIATWMITGDNEITAKAVADVVGIPSDNVIAGVLPQGKVRVAVYFERKTR
jgi:P-type E1-E2 ATPase